MLYVKSEVKRESEAIRESDAIREPGVVSGNGLTLLTIWLTSVNKQEKDPHL